MLATLVTAATAFTLHAHASNAGATQLMHRRVDHIGGDPSMVDLPRPEELALGATAVALMYVGNSGVRAFRSSREQASVDADLRERLRKATFTQAQTYREVPQQEVSPEVAAERLERRRAVLARAESMLDGVRRDVRTGLEEARLNNDQETIAEYEELLGKLNPLPEGIVPTSETPDFKRWIDPERRF